jgi:DNA-binding NarL/FixJ family response regulator
MTQPIHQAIKVAIVEDDPYINQGLQQYFELQSDICLILAASSVESFLDSLDVAELPDIVLMDIGLPGMSGIDGIYHIKQAHPHIEVMMLTIYPDVDKIFDALCAGATGYLLKNTPLPDIKKSLFELKQGGAPMSPAIARKVLHRFQSSDKKAKKKPSSLSNLTPREKEVVEAIVDGLAYKQIAQRLKIGLETVRQHIKNIYTKLQVNSKAQVISHVMNSNQ